MNRSLLYLISALTLTNHLHAVQTGSFEDFESLLSTASDIATEKSVNVDYLPSVVTVIDAQTFLDGGIINIGEALSMLPGIQMQMNTLGQPVTTVRGFKNPNSFLSDKIKILIDGVAINNEAAGTSGFFMDFPMQLVERIEVLRGPGSTIYGAGAFYGAVNIITKLGSGSDQQQVYAGIGSYKYGTAGANIHSSVGDWKFFADGYYAQNDKELEDNDKTTDEAMKNLSVGFKIQNGGLEFLTRYKSSHYGNFYLRKGDIEPNQDKGRKEDYFLAQLSYKKDFNDFFLQTKLNYSNRQSDITGYLSNNVSLVAAAFAVVGVNMQEAFYVKDTQTEENIEAEAILTLPEILSNDISIGLGIRGVSMPRNDFYSSAENAISQNYNTITTSPGYQYFPFRAEKEPAYWQDVNATDIFTTTNRTISYAHIQDLISLNETLEFVAGARADYYSDLGMNYSARLGLVYRANDALIFKLLYGSAFRAPTFTEAYAKGHIGYRAGDAGLKPEETDTYETAIIYKPNFNHKLALNFYYSTLTNVIDLEEKSATITGYQNMKPRTSKGVEFEYFFKTQQSHNLYFNASYVEAGYTVPAEDDSVEIDQSMPDISKIMLKAMYIFHPIKSLSFGTTWQYYSQTTKTKLLWVVDNNKETPAAEYHLLDETVTYKFLNHSELRLSIKNLLDEEVRLPSYYYTQPGGVLREGRNYYLTYSYNF